MKFEISIIEDGSSIYDFPSASVERHLFYKYFDIYMEKTKYELFDKMTIRSSIRIIIIYDDLETDVREYNRKKFAELFEIEL